VIVVKRRVPGILLSLLLLLSLTACGGELQGADSASLSAFYAQSSQVDLPVLGSSGDVNQNIPESNEPLGDVNQNNTDGNDTSEAGNQGEENVNRPDGKSDEGNASVYEDGWYTSKEEVALYIHLYEHLPDNYVTKDEAEDAGWNGGNVERYTGEGTAIGGSRFGNREGLLPKEQGRTYTECDIDTPGSNSRGAKRIVFSNDGLVYYTDDHYESFELLYGEP